VTTALKAVGRSGLVERLADGGWLLRGDPPDELSHLQWGHDRLRSPLAV
jgi:hypothetical protein